MYVVVSRTKRNPVTGEVLLASFLHILGQNDDLLPFYFAFDLTSIVVYQRYAANCSTPFGRKIGAFNLQVFDQRHGISGFEYLPIAVEVDQCIFIRQPGLRPGQGILVQVHHIEQLSGPALSAQAVEDAPGYDLYRRDGAPHAVIEAAPVIGVEVVRVRKLCPAGPASQYAFDYGRGIGRRDRIHLKGFALPA